MRDEQPRTRRTTQRPRRLASRPFAMRVAVISDIHANLHALEAVLADIDRRGASTRSGASATSSATGRARTSASRPRPRARHRRALRQPRPRRDRDARHRRLQRRRGGSGALDAGGARSRTRAPGSASLQPIGDATRRRALPRQPARSGLGLRAERGGRALLAARDDARRSCSSATATSRSRSRWDGEAIDGGLAPAGTEAELRPRRWLLNPGSVGQPRDGDARAAWLLIDDEAGRGTFRRVTYPIDKTQAEIRERGLPTALAARIAHGV